MSREAFEAWALRNTSLSSAHDIAWAAWQAALAQPQAEPVRLPLVQATAPRKIWLQISEDDSDSGEPFPSDLEGVTWCQDSVLACEVPYVRVDLATPQQAQPAPAVPEHVSIAYNMPHAAPAAPAVQPLTDEQIKASFVQKFGSDGWLGLPGSWYTEGYKAGIAAPGSAA